MPVCRLSTILKDVPYEPPRVSHPIESPVDTSTQQSFDRSITKATNIRFQTGPSIIRESSTKVREAIVFRK